MESSSSFCPSEAEQGCGWVSFAGGPVQQRPALSSVVVAGGKPGLNWGGASLGWSPSQDPLAVFLHCPGRMCLTHALPLLSF